MTKKAKVEQFDSVARERDLFMFACHDMQNDLIRWGHWMSESDGKGKYRAGLSRQGSLLVTVWHHPGQQDSIRVFDAVTEIENIRRLRNGSESWEPLRRAIDSATIRVTLTLARVWWTAKPMPACIRLLTDSWAPCLLEWHLKAIPARGRKRATRYSG